MRSLFLGCLLCAATFAGDKDFNGRWNIEVPKEPRHRVWWLEVTGAGTPKIKGRFVGSPGGDMKDIPQISTEGGNLKFVFTSTGNQPAFKGTWTARYENGLLHGKYEVEGRPNAGLSWTGHRAPVLKDKDDGKWKDGKAVELFNGKDLSGWSAMVAGQELGWEVKDGIMKNKAKSNNLVSAQQFWNFKLHCEFRMGPDSNGGFGLRGRYEVQVLDDFGQPPNTHGTGALYSRILPLKNAGKKPGEWNVYDITLIGRQVTVVVNGETVIDKGVIEGLTAMAHDWNEALPGPISVQGDHGAVEIRKLRITPLFR